ncbi:MAG: glycoside hydrolase family 9 protein, partial [Bacteroidales bacterium]|nr:glycoside hydrolase family 9 protein [Bacteroidales bacterium]
IDPLPMETGHEIIVGSDCPERMIKITSTDNELKLYDGRMLAQNGWYVLRSVIPQGKTGKVISWTIEPNAIDGWIRKPNIGFSQVGYIPNQPKTAVIELDKNDRVHPTAQIYKIGDDAKPKMVYEGKTDVWGNYFKYNYVKFDFTSVNTPGIYFIKYGDVESEHFIINDNVYDKITDATSDIWIPIHLNHIMVNEGYRIWHGEPFKEGYIQAPPSDHFDLHFQGATDTKYKPYELIPGLNVGGFFDAGDFDIETGSNISVVQNLVRTWELFRSERDETFVDEKQRYVDLHRPDGVPDILQYIEHGVLNLVAQAENIGYMATTLSNGVLDNYHHLGDAASITDGLRYDPKLPPYTKSADGKWSGTKDDMWAFTTRNPMLDNRAATMFAAASRVLKGYNDDLANRALVQSKRLFKEAQALIEQRRAQNNRHTSGEHDELSLRGFGDIAADIQLYAATREQQYLDNFEAKIWKALDYNVNFTIQTALDAVPYMPDGYKEKLRPYMEKYKVYLDSLAIQNPYGIPIGLGNWAGGGQTVSHGTAVCYAHKYFPDIIGKEYAFKTVAWLFGCHPYHNYSLVAVIGATHPKSVFYGNNRADFSFIPGNVAPGLLFRKPDHFENYDDWP